MTENADSIRDGILSLVKRYFNARFAKKEFEPGSTPVRYAGRVFDESEMVNLVDSALDFWLTAGRFSEEFEANLSELMDLSESIIVNSGSSANLLAITALTSPKLGDKALRPGDEVITTAAGFPSTLSPIIQNQLVPVFVDVELGTYNAIPEQIEAAVGKRSKAVFIPHTLGNPFDVEAVTRICEKANLILIEDNCDALGSLYDGKMTGTFGLSATLSFYPAHHITMGEGGCVVTDDVEMGNIIRSYRDWGRDCYCGPGENNTCGKRFNQQYGTLPYGYDHKYVYSHIGYNLKATDMQAAIGVAQLRKLADFNQRRRANFLSLFEGLKRYEDRLLLPWAQKKSDPAWFGFPIGVRSDSGFSRDDLVAFLVERKIETRNLFGGNLLRQPAFQDIERRQVGELPNSDFVMSNVFFIGTFPGIDTQQLDYILDSFEIFFGN